MNGIRCADDRTEQRSIQAIAVRPCDAADHAHQAFAGGLGRDGAMVLPAAGEALCVGTVLTLPGVPEQIDELRRGGAFDADMGVTPAVRHAACATVAPRGEAEL